MPFHVKGKYGDDGAPKDDRFFSNSSYTGTISPDQNCSWQTVQTETYGESFVYVAPFDPSNTGFRVTYTAIHNTVSGDSWTAVLQCPWGEFYDSGTGLPTKLTSRFEIDNCPGLDVNSACDATLEFDEFRWYMRVDSGSYNIVSSATYGPFSASFTGFDLRLNNHQTVRSVLTATSVPTRLPSCVLTTPADQATKTLTPECSGTSGWDWRHVGASSWSVDTVDALADDTLPSVTCSCPDSLPTSYTTIASDSLPGSYALSDRITVIDYGSGGTVTLSCPLGGSVTGYLWSVRQQFDISSVYYSAAVPNTFPITPIRQTLQAYCGTVGTSTSEDHDHSDSGKSLIVKSHQSADGTKICWHKTSGACFPVTPPNTNDPPIPSDTPWCGYTCSRTDTWPNIPPCTGSSNWIHNTQTPEGRFFRTDIGDGDVFVYGSDFHIPPFGVTTQVTSTGDCIRPAIGMEPRGRLHLVYARLDGSSNPTAYHRVSDDDAESFTSEDALGISNGTYPYVATDPDGGALFAALVYDAGTSGPGKIYAYYLGPGVHAADAPTPIPIVDDTGTAITFADSTFAFAFAFHGARALVLSALVDGETETSEWQCWSYEDDSDAGYLSFKRVT